MDREGEQEKGRAGEREVEKVGENRERGKVGERVREREGWQRERESHLLFHTKVDYNLKSDITTRKNIYTYG